MSVLLPGFCHLNVHTDRSLLRGLIKPKKLVEWCKQVGIDYAAITDHANISAAIELQKTCKESKIKPIYGMEVNLTLDKTKRVQGSQQLILLAKNRIGFQNLIRLATIGSMYFYYIPRIDFTDLEKYGEGLIVMTSGLNSPVAQEFFIKKKDGIAIAADRYRKLFGNDFYIEIEPAPGELQMSYNSAVIQYCEETNCGVVATADCHYVNEQDRELHEIVMAVKQTKNSSWLYPFKGKNHLKLWDEMVEDFSTQQGYDVSQHFLRALETPFSIAESIESFELSDGKKLPSYIWA